MSNPEIGLHREDERPLLRNAGSGRLNEAARLKLIY
jgi:hypothetical protein